MCFHSISEKICGNPACMRQHVNHKANTLRQMCICQNISLIYSVGGNRVELMHINLLMLSTANNTASKHYVYIQEGTQSIKTNLYSFKKQTC